MWVARHYLVSVSTWQTVKLLQVVTRHTRRLVHPRPHTHSLTHSSPDVDTCTQHTFGYQRLEPLSLPMHICECTVTLRNSTLFTYLHRYYRLQLINRFIMYNSYRGLNVIRGGGLNTSQSATMRCSNKTKHNELDENPSMVNVQTAQHDFRLLKFHVGQHMAII
jgi:hypothetical protein